MNFSRLILQWYKENKRLLPWRETSDPYRIWLSEIMLQQTRVAQGTPYYLKFIKAYPVVQDLARAKEEEVLKLWQGLGYYSRARNLHATAKIITEQYDGKFPSNFKELLSLKGVGDYTASAIASICFNLPKAVVDGNVYRVLARYYGVDLPINSREGVHYFKEKATEVMDTANIRDYNQGIMEFGALQCTPQNPNCGECPLQKGCVSFSTNSVGSLPVKLKKNKVRDRYFNYLVLIDENKKTVLQQRKGRGIWQNLYEFPLLESEKDIEVGDLTEKLTNFKGLEEPLEVDLYNKDKIVHKLSHQHLHTRFWIVTPSTNLEEGIPIGELYKYPVPVLIADFIKTLKI